MSLGVLPIVSVLVIFFARMLEVGTKRDVIAGKVRESLTFRLFLLAGVLMVGGGITEFVLKGMAISWPMFAAGWVAGLLSFVIRRRAIAALGRFWSLHVEIRDNHQLVKDGPFRFMRHPTYFSMILELLSAGLILGAVYTLAVVFLVFVPALYLRLKLEEFALVEKFGDAYKKYQKSTPAIFPYKWPVT
jgi:protein-S-isoprenylcysteine O-methyltransferase Ste14